MTATMPAVIVIEADGVSTAVETVGDDGVTMINVGNLAGPPGPPGADGVMSAASNAETITGTSTAKAVTPAGLKYERPYLDVRSYGAVGDGSSDDTAPIQAAIDAASTAGGGIVQFTAASYVITAPLNMINKSGVHLRGVSMVKTKIIQTTLTVPVIKVSGAYMGIHDMVLQYGAAANTVGADVLQLDGLTRFSVFENLYLWNCHTGIKLAGVTSPRGEYSNVFSNIRIGPFSAQGIQLIPAATGGTGSVWNNIYINNYNGTTAGACTGYPLQIQNHQAAFNQLNIEWCDVVTAATDLAFFHQCAGVVINSFHLEGNKLPASRGFITTFTSGACTVQINGLWILNNTAATGSIGIVRPGAGTSITLSNVNLQTNTGIAANWYVIFDTSAATGAVVIVDQLQDLSSHLDGFSLSYAGTAYARGYKGATVGFFGAVPVARPTVPAAATDAATTMTLVNSIRTALVSLGLTA